MAYESDRRKLVETLERRLDVNEGVLEAIETVPRHEFVPENRRQDAYEDRPLPIGDGQTISAPHMVAIMADLLDLEPGDRVLEIGTGRGYHAAVTAELVGAENVSTVEYSRELGTRARDLLEDLGYDGVRVRIGDGKEGWPERAPYDAAYLTCAATDFPRPVVDQVRSGGRLLAPLGRIRQTLVLAEKRADGSLERSEHGGVRFVRLR